MLALKNFLVEVPAGLAILIPSVFLVSADNFGEVNFDLASAGTTDAIFSVNFLAEIKTGLKILIPSVFLVSSVNFEELSLDLFDVSVILDISSAGTTGVISVVTIGILVLVGTLGTITFQIILTVVLGQRAIAYVAVSVAYILESLVYHSAYY